MKNRSAIILLFIANSISGCAQGISMLAIPWYFAKNDASGFFGKLFIGVTLLSLFWGLYAGSLIDRFDRKHLFLAINTVGFVLISAVSGYGHYSGSLDIWGPAFVFGMTIFIFNIHFPSYYAFAQEITEKRLYQKINSWLEIQNQFMFVMSGAIGAILLEGTSGGTLKMFGMELPTSLQIEAWKIHEIFTIDAVTYLVALIVISFIRYTPIAERTPEAGSLLERLRTGIAFLNKNHGILLFGVSTYVVFATILVSSYYVMPRYVRDHLLSSGDVYASGEMLFAIGAMTTGILLSNFMRNIKFIPALMTFMVIVVGIYLMLYGKASVAVFLAMNFLLGFSNSGIRIFRITYLFKIVPNQVIGRTGSILSMLNVIMRLALTSILLLPFFQRPENIEHANLVFMGIVIVGLVGLLVYATTFKAEVDRAQSDN